jgi:lambda family phage tail tape measure protein
LPHYPAALRGAKGAEDARAEANTPSTNPRDIIQERINQLKKETAELTNIGNIAVKVADGIGSAFSTSFKGIIDGSMTARQALSNFFQSLADMFLDMAAQIIAKMITMAILNAVLGVLPGAGGGLGTAVSPEVGAIGQGSSIFAAANGATFANGIATFARGGAFTNSIVGSPTMFKFAQGGAMRTGLMGEAGPEAIMPLTRGPGGQLGVSNFRRRRRRERGRKRRCQRY